MQQQLVESLVSIVTAIIGLAIVSVIISKNAQTANVIKSGGSVLASILKATVQPVT